MESDVLYVPEEIIRNILKRLPVKSLIRFQCVCKHWNSLIKNRSFIVEHLQQSSHQNPSLLFQCGTINPPLRHFFCFLDCRFQVVDVQKAPLNDSFKDVRIISSCNGLICLEIKSSKSPPPLLLWNPATSAVRHLPITKPDPLRPVKCVTGFGVSEDVDNFKIVRAYAPDYETVKRVEVFSSGRGTWELIDLGNLKDVQLHSETVTVNGAIFWSGTKRYGVKQGSEEEVEDDIEVGEHEDYMDEEEVEEEEETKVQVIVSFDIAKEVFTVIPRPHLDYNAEEKLTVYENKLAILCDSWEDDDDDDETPCWIDLWVLDEVSDASGKTWSWSKRYSSSPLSYTLESKAIWGNEIVYRIDSTEDNEKRRNVLCLINIATNEVKRVSNPYGASFRGIYNYVGSLVSIGLKMQSLQKLPLSRLLWIAPSEGCIKVNVNGAVSTFSGRAACGGVLRNHEGIFVHGFMVNLGFFSRVEAEFWGLLWGLKIAWDLGFRWVKVNCDCAVVVNAIEREEDVDNLITSVISQVRNLIQRRWMISVSKCSRGANGVADCLAEKALSLHLDFLCFSSVPEFLKSSLEKDMHGLRRLFTLQ